MIGPKIGVNAPHPEAAALATELKNHLTGEVRFDSTHRVLYSQDASNYAQMPMGVVCPRTPEEVEKTVAICRHHDVPLLPRGSGTSLAGQACNVAVVLDTSRHLKRILEIDPVARIARVEPGVVLDDLRAEAAKYGLTFGPDPATHVSCTLGGMIGNNACGVHSLMAGRTSDNIEALDVLTYDGYRLRVDALSEAGLDRACAEEGRVGEIHRGLKRIRDRYGDLIRERYPKIPRRVSGYNLDDLLPESGCHVARSLVGTEGTCVTVLEAVVHLVPSQPCRSLIVLGFPDVPTAADWVPELLSYRPIGLEGMDHLLVDNMRAKGVDAPGLDLFPEGRGWLFVEFGGSTPEEAREQARRLTSALGQRREGPTLSQVNDPEDARRVWATRELALGYIGRLIDGRDTCEGWEDSAVAPERLGDYIRDFRALIDKHGYTSTFYGHFGQGLVHNRIDFDLTTEAGIRKYRCFVEEAADLVVRYGGSLSGEHGDGQSRAELLPRMYGEELVRAFGEFKALWDPHKRMNPGKVVEPRRLDADLRFGPGYRLPHPSSQFDYPHDDHNFARAMARCVGVGRCLRPRGETMCPSYRVTGEERHTTRGRARLLYRMLEGRLEGGWKSEAVRESLDLCLGCKGCKRDCPASVDVATYKAEFLSHYYEGRLLPRQAYAFGWIHRWARLAAYWPTLANFLTQAPVLSGLAKRAGGIAPQREIPRFASVPFHTQYRRQGDAAAVEDANRPPVLLWPDTFNNFFRPHVAQAGVKVIHEMGHRPVLPPTPLCCGRPLYDFGMLRLAKELLKKVLDRLRPFIRKQVPMIVLEPSCAAVFRDELGELFPDDPNALALRGLTYTLAEWLKSREDWSRFAPPWDRVLYHPHCHQNAVMGAQADIKLLRHCGLQPSLPDAGCCGMAGSFGFKKEHFTLSQQIGERGILPAVREASERTGIIADGFSCAEQIRQGTGRQPLHLAEVLAQGVMSAGTNGA